MTDILAIALFLAAVFLGLLAFGFGVVWLAWLLAYFTREDSRAGRSLLVFSAAIPAVMGAALACFYLSIAIGKALFRSD